MSTSLPSGNPIFHWYLPTVGDSRALLERGENRRIPDIGYLKEVALAAERNGFESLLTPTGRSCPDPWLITAALTQVTSRIKFLVAFRPGLVHPTLMAQMAQTFQEVSGGRLALNVVTGADDAEQMSYGDFINKSSRYSRADEFLSILKQEWAATPYVHEGEFYKISKGGLPALLIKRPPIFFGGASPQAESVSARHADVQLFFGETPPMLRERIARLRELSAQQGRDMAFGVRLHVINRDSSDEAWAHANRLLDGLPEDIINRAQQRFRDSGAVGHQRLAALHDGTKRDRDALQVYPNIWAGSSLIYGNPALVGNHAEVAQRISEYRDAGITHFIMSGYPRLESSYEFGESVIPLFNK
ncbi:LLM class flavin-dependent oxidoreductase [Pseudomonas sp. v388]|uniref:LLM class flavin-dependent oxidoreductase n=1 Tax=Pseudomonas sp. v388 TaxID=2479849 RepID=UPI001C499A18|nr:LLM class flavin-dependent oxidoreductase [Pseudomonas sp. v388]